MVRMERRKIQMDRYQRQHLSLPTSFLIFAILNSLIQRVQVAGGRGGAVTKGGTNRAIGPHLSDPNDDSGSLSVILVVILPVAQMFFFVALIILMRMCYRRYCLRSGRSSNKKSKSTNKAAPSLWKNVNGNCASSVKKGSIGDNSAATVAVAGDQQITSIAMTSISPMEVMSPLSVPRNSANSVAKSNGGTHNGSHKNNGLNAAPSTALTSVLVVNSNVATDPLTATTTTLNTMQTSAGCANSGTAASKMSTVQQLPNGCLAHGGVPRCSPSSTIATTPTGSAVLSTSSSVLPVRASQIYAPVVVESHHHFEPIIVPSNCVTLVQQHRSHHQFASNPGSSNSNRSTLPNCPPSHHHHIPPVPPHSMSLPSVSHQQQQHHLHHHSVQHHTVPTCSRHLHQVRCSTLQNDTSLASDMIDSEDGPEMEFDLEEMEELTTEEVSSRQSSGGGSHHQHQSNCIFHHQYYHPQHQQHYPSSHRSYNSRPASANSASTSTMVSRCMQTY